MCPSGSEETNLDAMYGRAIDVRDRLIGLPELGNVRVGTRPGRPEIHVEVLPEVAARYDLEPRTIADAVDAATRGDLATGLVDFDRKIGVIVRYPRDLGRELRTLETLKVAGVPLREFVRVQRTSGPREVYREGQARVIPVYADVHDGGLDQAIERIRASIDDLRPVAGLRMDVAGEGDEMKRSFRGLSFAFALGLALVYMILAAQFESFVHPLTVLVPVPLALVGAVLALLFTGQGDEHDGSHRRRHPRWHRCERRHREGRLHQSSAGCRPAGARRHPGGGAGAAASPSS